MKAIKHVWFDFSDTLASIDRDEYNKILYSSYAVAVKKEVTPELIEEYEQKFKTLKSNSAVFVSLGLSSSYLADRLSAVDPQKLYQLADNNIPRVITELTKVLPVSIFSNNKMGKLLPALGLKLDYFTHIIGPDMVKNPKPALEGFYKMVELSKLPANELIFIGDDVHKDLLPAKEVGIVTGLMWKTASEADYCFKDFDAILEFFT